MDQGLFGPSPAEIQQMQTQAMMQRAQQFAEMNPQQRATAGMYKAGGMLAGPVGGMLGMSNPAVEQAKRTEQIMGSGGDLTTSDGMLKKADEFRQAGDIRTATALLMKGKEMQRQEQAAALAARKQDFQENQQYELKLMQLAQMGEAARQRSEDTRMSIEQRREAAREANAIRMEIARLAASSKQSGGMTANEKRQLDFEQKEREKQEKADLSVDLANQKYNVVTGAINEALQNTGFFTTGATGKALSMIPGTDAFDLEGTVDTIVSNLGFNELQAMRQASPTGGALGSIAVKELQILQSTIASLRMGQSQEKQLKSLATIKDSLEKWKDAVTKNAQQSGKSGAPTAPPKPLVDQIPNGAPSNAISLEQYLGGQ